MFSVPRWEKYKGFFQVTVFRYLVLWFSIVPIVVTLLEGFQKPLVLMWNNQKIVLQLTLPFSWQLLWLSSLLFFIALALYHWWCPPFIKKYNQFSEYQSYANDPRWLAWEAKHVAEDPSLVAKFTQRLTTKKFLKVLPDDVSWDLNDNPTVEEQQTTLRFQSEGKKYALSTPILDQNNQPRADAEKGIFWEIFGRFSESKYSARLTILIFLILSSICFLVVLCQHIVFGIGELCIWIRSVI